VLVNIETKEIVVETNAKGQLITVFICYTSLISFFINQSINQSKCQLI